jgi:hypothetical protein
MTIASIQFTEDGSLILPEHHIASRSSVRSDNWPCVECVFSLCQVR